MPNVKGLDPAPILHTSLRAGEIKPYGLHAKVALDGTTVVLTNEAHRVIATVDFASAKPRVRSTLGLIDRDTITAVNAFLSPYGKVKQYWRLSTKEKPVYRWHPHDGKASPVPTGVTRTAEAMAPRAAFRVPVKDTTVTITPTATPRGGVRVDEVVPDPEPEPEISAPAPVAVAHPTTLPVIATMKRWQDRGSRRPIAKAVTKTYSIVDDVLLPTSDLRILDAMGKQRAAGRPSFALITGPAGTAKTRLAQAWAFVNDLPVVIVEGQSIQTASDWYGSLVPDVGSSAGWKWEWSDAAKMILTGQPCVVVIDELNRPENERALNGIMGLMDWKATAKPVSAPHEITLKPGQCIIATLNEGPEYVGTVEVDAAVRDRYGLGVRMAYPSEVIERRILMQQVPGLDKEVATRLVRVAASQRAKRDDDTLYPSHNVISVRVLIDVAAGIVISGLEPAESIWASCRARFAPEDEPALKVLIEAQFGATPETIDDSLAEDDDIEHMLGDI